MEPDGMERQQSRACSCVGVWRWGLVLGRASPYISRWVARALGPFSAVV